MPISNLNQLVHPVLNGRETEAGAQTATKTAFAPVPAWKRALDVAFVLLVTPFLVPIGIIIYAFIKISSPGPAFFRQQRVGLHRRRFMCLKFRTMRVNADTGAHKEHLTELMTKNQVTKKLDNKDKRLIAGGMWLRAAGLDELPQLFNVLCGDMSLVGPRPCIPFEFELYSERQKQRCDAPPGMTGLWQVSGKNKTTFEQMMEYDLKYVREMSLWLDLKIIVMTIPAILLLIWEMKILPKFIKSPEAASAQTNAPQAAAQPGRLPGTLPAKD